jgi:hypothetical protein
MIKNFQDMVPRSIFAEADPELMDKKGATFTGFTGGTGYGFNQMQLAGMGGMGSNNILRNPSRRFYDPEITTTAIYLPRNIRQKNRWCRWFFDHDEFVGAVLELHAELPYSRAEIVVDDTTIKRHIEECLDKTNFFSMLPAIDLEFMKIGEVFIHTPWDEAKGMWSHIIIHNPDFIEVRTTPFADSESVIELRPDDELRKIVHSTKPEDQQLKKRLPKEVVRRVLTGKNIMLDSREVTHIARRSNPYDIRGTSLLNRLFRLLMYEDKLREAQITIADNFIYPLKIFKLGDPQKGWIPDESHQRALAQMLQNANFDPNFSLIYHYGLQVEYMTVADKVMRLDKEWQEISEKKMIALGISKEMLLGGGTYACFTEGTQITTPNGIKNIETVSKGDFVLDKDGLSQKVINNWCEGIPETITKIKLWGNKEIACTSNHKWPVWAWPRTCACGCGKEIKAGKAYAHSIGNPAQRPQLKKLNCGRGTINNKYQTGVPLDYNPMVELSAENIKAWDYLMIPRKFNEVETNVSRDKARLLGYFLAEGNYSKHCRTKELTGINLTFSIAEKNTLVKEAKELCEKIGIPIIQIEEKTGSLRLRSANREEFKDSVLWFKENAGEYSHQKKLSEEVMRWPIELKKELIKGIFKGDGCHQAKKCIGKNAECIVSYTTTSEVLANQIELILAQLGFPVNWVVQDNKIRNLTSKYKRKVTYRLDIFGKFAYDLEKLVWGEDSKFAYKNTTQFLSQKAGVDDNYVYTMIRSVETIKNTKKVYNLTVENTHSYLVKNIGTYNSANVGLQTQLARYRSKRDLFEVRWMMDKFFRVMAEKNEWYKRDAREILGHYRVKRTAEESRQRLIMPKMMWHKKLMMRDDQQFLTFLNNVYAQGKDPISAITMLMSMGLDTESELRNKSRQKEFEEMIGEYIQTPAAVGPATPGGGLGAMAKLKGKLKFGKQEKVAEEPVSKDIEDREFVGHADKGHKIADKSAALLYEEDSDNDLTNDIIPVNSDAWSKNISSPNVPSEVIFAMTAYDNKLRALQKKYNGGFKEGITENSKDLLKSLVDMYVQGKLTAYGWTNFLPIYRQHYAQGEDLRDYSDIVLSNEFEDWIVDLSKMAMETDKLYKHVRDLANTCYCYGQLKGFQEQGIYSVKVSNSESMDGLRYTVGELNKKGKNLSSIVSPMGEIVMFSPCIEGFDDEDFGNSIDSNIKRYKDSYVAGIQINNCPVEISPFLERYVNKFGKYLKKEYDNVVFVADVINLPAWEESQKRKIEAELKDIKDEVRQYVVINRLAQDKFSKVGKIPSYKQGRIMYISNWVGMEDTPITANLLKYLPITDDSLYKSVEKTFKVASNDLTKDEINTYKIFGYIQPLYDGNEEIMGWRAVEGINKVDGVDEKVVFGKNWDSAGRCASTYTREPRQLFEDNVRLWIDYPNKLSATVKAWFESL